jgi:hypothetical protein
MKKAMKHRRPESESQLPLFEDPSLELRKALAGLNLDHLTPIQAFELLKEWKTKWGSPSPAGDR